uniref:Uncharacterized protein n=1 Tax=Nelumbo nucifera TaxID=4432 RepID=A0A822XHH3_NELNU|nr:TPA_asm: hypothetical protein HUJ06_020875 [Nelumbo nucifera]
MLLRVIQSKSLHPWFSVLSLNTIIQSSLTNSICSSERIRISQLPGSSSCRFPVQKDGTVELLGSFIQSSTASMHAKSSDQNINIFPTAVIGNCYLVGFQMTGENIKGRIVSTSLMLNRENHLLSTVMALNDEHF